MRTCQKNLIDEISKDSNVSTKSFNIRVSTKTAANRIKIEKLSNGEKLIKVFVTAAPEDGKANKAVIKLLSKTLGVPQSNIAITSGLTSKNKVITVTARH